MTSRLRVALVGAGTMGSLHARVIAQSARCELAYVIDADESVGRAVAERWNSTWLRDLEQASDVHAVVCATATESHHEIGRQVLDRQLPLLMEKPLAGALVDSEELVAQSAKADVPLMCGLLERYNAAILTALAVVEDARHITAVRHSPYVPRIRIGVSSDLLIHDVDLVLRFAGVEPSVVRGSFGYLHPNSPDGSEDVAEAMLAFPNGMVSNVSASRVSQRKVRRVEIAEPDRLVEVDMLRNTVTIFRHVLNDAGEDGRSYRQQTIMEIPALVSSREPLAAQLDHFLDLATGKADAAAERSSILPSHRIVDLIRTDASAR